MFDLFSNNWEDYLIVLAQVIFAVSMLPTVFSKHKKPPLLTCVPTAFALYLMAVSLFSLGASFGSGMTLVNALLWTIVSWQRYLLDKREK